MADEQPESVLTEEQTAAVSAWCAAEVEAKAAKKIVAREQEMRKALIADIFDHPKEGANKATLPKDWQLKLTYKIDRKLDEALIASVRDTLEGEDMKMDGTIDMVPKLIMAGYKKLPKSGQKIVDMALTTKPGSHTLELIPPKYEADK